MIQPTTATLESERPRARASLQWEPRRRLSLDRARRRSSVLQLWRLVFLALAAGAAGSLLVAISLHSLGGGFGGRGEVANAEALTIRNPRFTGRDTGGSPFVVTADTARRRARDSSLIDLDRVRYETRAGHVVTASSGTYDSQERVLQLAGDVTFLDAANRVFRSDTASLYAREDVVRGDSPIVGSGPLGDIRADAYEFQAEGGHIRLRGNVKGTLRGSGETAAP